jgi:hypothetical protein
VESIDINAPLSRVWEIVSDLDNEPEYWWGTREIRNISREGNVVHREIYQNFRKHAILQKVLLTPQKEIEIQYLRGLTEGVKYIRVNSVAEDKQSLVTEWKIHFTGIYFFATPFIARHVRKGTKDALQRIKDVSEGRPIQHTEEIADANRK